MTYDRNNPGPLESLGQTQPVFYANGNTIDDTIKQDHVAMGTLGQGKHNWMTLVNAIPAIPAAGANEVIVYKDPTNYINVRLQSTSSDYKLAFGNISVNDYARLGTDTQYDAPNPVRGGWTMLPGTGIPMIMNYGHVDSPGLTGTINFARQFVGPIIQVPILSIIAPTAGFTYAVTFLNNTGFAYRISGAGVSRLNFTAVGN